MATAPLPSRHGHCRQRRGARRRLLAKARALLEAGPSLTRAETALVLHALATLERVAPGLAVTSTHGDYQPRNMLWNPASGTIAIIDFEKAAPGPAARDIALLSTAPPEGRADLRTALYEGLGRVPDGDEQMAVAGFTVLNTLVAYAWGEANGDHEAMADARAILARNTA